MAEPNPLVQRRRYLRVKLEGTKGDPIATDTRVLAFDPRMEPIDSLIPRRPAHRSGGGIAAVVGERLGRCRFTAELRSDGVSALDDGLEILLQCCGWKLATGVYSPTILPSEQKTCTINQFEDGRLKQLSGCMGNATIRAEAGRVAMVEFEMQGVWGEVTDVALPAAAASGTTPIRLASATLTIGEFAPRVAAIALSLNSEIVGHENVANAAGYDHMEIGDVDPTVELDPLAVLVAGEDVWGKWLDGTPSVLTIALTDGTVDIAIAAAEFQYRTPTDSDRGGRTVDQYVGQCNDDDDDGDALTMTVS